MDFGFGFGEELKGVFWMACGLCRAAPALPYGVERGKNQ